jgi:hypothetical protein
MPSDVKTRVKEIAAQFESLIDVPVVAAFSGHTFNVKVRSVGQAKITDLALVPEKRERDGKAYTPPMLAVVCDVGTMLFVLEDTEFVVGLQGPVLKVADYGTVAFSKGDHGSASSFFVRAV